MFHVVFFLFYRYIRGRLQLTEDSANYVRYCAYNKGTGYEYDGNVFVGWVLQGIVDISVPGHFGTDLDKSVLNWTSRYSVLDSSGLG